MAAVDEPVPEKADEPGRLNLITPTLGGLQYWQDEHCFHDWRIQRQVFTGHCRLLDGANFRHAWGTYEQCATRLEQIKRERNLPAMQGKIVIALHGLIRTRASMNSLCNFLHEQGGYAVVNINYPSTQAEVGSHAAALAKIIGGMKGVQEINFVSHSLGGLVIRHYLADQTDAAVGRQPDPRIKRIVMLGPPNKGAEIAEKLGRNPAFKAVFGPSGQQLARYWSDLEKRLAIPACEFGILAGGRGQEQGFNPLVQGDNDLVVSVDGTKLPGAADFAVLPVSHSFMMNDRTVQEYTLRFLQHGYFVASDKRQPIGALDVPAGQGVKCCSHDED